MIRSVLFAVLAVGSTGAWACDDQAEPTAECLELELERVTNAYLKAALQPEFLASLAADPSPDAGLVASMLLAFPPNFDEDPSAAPSEAALARADAALATLLEDHPDYLPARIVALDRCERCDLACLDRHGSALRRNFPEDATGYLIGAHHAWETGQPDRAHELLSQSAATTVYGGGIGGLVRAIHDVLDRLPRTVDDDPYDRRDVALYQVGFGLTAGLRIPYLKSIQEMCIDQREAAVIEACLTGARALTLPGTNLVHSAIALHLERSLYQSLGDEENLDRAITRTALLHECAEANAAAGWHRDPAATAAYIEDLEHHGECRALHR